MKTWFITGASSGLGLGMAKKLLERGDAVVATARRVEALASIATRFPDRLSVERLDVTDREGMRRTVDQAFGRGRIDVVVSNAGYGLFGAAEELSDDEIERQIATNLTGSIRLIRAVLPHLRAQGGGRILQLASEGGQIAYPGFSAYHATKWGIEGFAEAVAQEVAPFGIEVTIVEPGPTATGFAAGLAVAPETGVYAGTPAGEVRTMVRDGAFGITGDVARMVGHIRTATTMSPAPRRLALGSAAYDHIREALTARLAELEALKHLTLDSDLPPR